jgi:hypothetical protein
MKVAIMLAGAVLFVSPLYAQNPAPAAPATAAPAVVSAPVEETLTMTGTLEKKPEKTFYVFITDGKRMVMPSDAKQWPAGVSPADLMEKNVTLTAVVVTKERDGRKNSFISKIISIQKAETPAAPAQ